MKKALRPLLVLTALAVLVAGCSNAPAGTGKGNSNSTTAARAKAVRFAECMRAHGVGAFPDPDASGQLTIDGVANGSSVDPSSPLFQQALSACKGLEPAGFMGQTRTPEQQKVALKFAQCMRDDGVTDFPDPTPNGPLIDTNRIPSAATSDGMSILSAAMHKCGAIYSGELGVRRQ